MTGSNPFSGADKGALKTHDILMGIVTDMGEAHKLSLHRREQYISGSVDLFPNKRCLFWNTQEPLRRLLAIVEADCAIL
nr:hypothetical protein [Rhizobium lusitanum]